MAKSQQRCTIFPQFLSQEQRGDKRRSAEVKLYDALHTQLGPEWTVFYDVAWLAPVSGDVPQDGQTDFLIAHPDRGILIIEVKGGRINFDGEMRSWTSTDRDDKSYSIDPVTQIRNSKSALLSKLKSLPKLSSTWINMYCAIAFPDCVIPEHTTIDLPPEIIIGKDDLQYLSEKIEAIFDHCGNGAEQQKGSLLMAELRSLLAKSVVFVNPFARQLADEEQHIITLTDEQFEALDSLARNRRVAISGCAGSGKTLLAYEKATQLANEGYKTLLTCYNRPLAAHLKSLRPQLNNLTIDSFFGFCRRQAQTAGMDLPQFGVDRELNNKLEQQYPETLLQSIEYRQDLRFDAIVVDEGQDFASIWWVALESCLRSEHAIFYIFYDDNQVLYRRDTALPDNMVQYRLRKNIRNARPIFDLVSQHYRSTDKGEIKPCGPEGREVERLSYSTDREMQNCVGEALSRYITREGIASKDVVVLTPKRLDRSNLLGLKLPTGLQMVRLEDQNLANQVACSTIHSFKGLERKIVLVAELDDELFQLAAEERASRCYVAFSRAQSHLAVVATPSVLKRLALPQ